MTIFKNRKCLAALLLLVASSSSAESDSTNISKSLPLEKAITLAKDNDIWMKGSVLREQSLLDEAEAVGQLPDPVMSLGVANLPIDSFKHDQENMTQLKVGITQRFPRGDSLDLQSQKSLLKSEVNPYMRAERSALLQQKVSELWLDSYQAEQTIKLIESERHLFEQLVDVTNARYTSTAGKAKQHDVVRAQLELTKLEDRLTRLKLLKETSKNLLEEWLPVEWHGSDLTDNLPTIELLADGNKKELIEKVILQHPRLQIIDKKITIEEADINIAKQAYKSGWALNTSYAYRDDAPDGMERDDFISVGVSFDLPMFSAGRNDKKVSAASLRKQASTTDYELARRHLMANFYKAHVRLMRLDERSSLYKKRLLKQMHDQTDAALSAYTNDNGDFAEVMRAYIAELNSKIEALEIETERQKARAQLNYLLAGVNAQNTGTAGENNE